MVIDERPGEKKGQKENFKEKTGRKKDLQSDW